MKLKLFLYFLIISQSVALAQQHVYRNFYTQIDAEKKTGLALVLANNDYQNSTNLAMAISDGEEIVTALKEVGFDIEIGFNLNKADMLDAIIAFADKLPQYEYAMVYYSGHGVQFGGENYILPSDAKASTRQIILKNSAISINEIFKTIDDPSVPKIVILDACRENPFLNQLTAESREVGGIGLSKVEASKNSMVIFSTSLNTLVPDNNQFAELFSQNVKNGGCIENIVKQTRNDVLNTDRTQLIWTNEALTGNVCFGDSPSPNIDVKDADNDGIPDSVDNCKNQFGFKALYGCPLESYPSWQKKITNKETPDYEIAAEITQLKMIQHPEAYVRLGYLFDNGIGVKHNLEEAVIYYKKAISGKITKAEALLGKLYVRKWKYKEAYPWLLKAAQNKDGEAAFTIGQMKLTGRATAMNYDEASSWLKKACDWGNNGCRYTKMNKEELLLAGAKMDIASAENSKELYTMVWETYKNVDALYRLALLDFRKNLKGVPIRQKGEPFCFTTPKLVNAFEYAKRKSENGDLTAMFVLNDMYKEGHGTCENDEKSFYWLKKVAELGDTRAFSEMGFRYWRGYGGAPKNIGNSKYWYTRACDAGSKQSCSRLKRL